MKLYFVRHGSTDDWENGLHQHRDSSLSATGRKQAELVAERVSSLPIDTIIASPYNRAKETAEIIAARLKKEISFDEILKEIKRPSAAEQKPHNDPEVIAIMDQVRKNFFESDWHHSDEENFIELYQRARAFLSLVEGLPAEHVLAVSHGLFIKVMMIAMMAGDQDPALFYNPVNDFFYANNTGLTICQKDDDGWKMLTWNDYAHLPE